MPEIPEMYVEAVRSERDALLRLVAEGRAMAANGDSAGLTAFAELVHRQIERADAISRTGGHLTRNIDDIIEAFDDLFDRAFPVQHPTDPAEVLDAPWPSRQRAKLVGALVDRPDWPKPPLAALVERAVDSGDVRLLRLLVWTRIGRIERVETARMLDALHAADSLDAALVEYAFTEDPYLGRAIAGDSDDPDAATEPAACAAVVHDHVDEMLWRMTAPGEPAGWRDLPKMRVPRGLRFVRRALAWQGDERVAVHLGAAELTDIERKSLLELLRDEPPERWRAAFDLRLPAGDAETLLPLFGLASAAPLLRLILRLADAPVIRHERAEILSAAEAAGERNARELLAMCPSEIVSAALGWNRVALLKRFRNNALQGIAAYGLLPLEPDESVLDRYLALRESARNGARFGPNRRQSHAAAIGVALAHLAQVAGLRNADHLEWDCEAGLAEETPTGWRLDGYQVALRLDGADPQIAVSNDAGKRLRSVPPAVRADPRYAEIRAHQERLRDQARRMRTGLIERLVATEGSLDPDELARLSRLPSGAALLPALIWRDRADTIGLLDQVDRDGPVTAVHPSTLYERGLLARWQAEIVGRRIRQPVKQAFRELYVPTPAEHAAGDRSSRFAGQRVSGRVAVPLLAGRGWAIHDRYDDEQLTRRLDDRITAAVRCDFGGYFGQGDVTVGEVRFLAAGSAVPLVEVAPVLFSEVMRDLDLVVSVAGTGTGAYHSPAHAASRAQLLGALIGDLGLDRVTVDGSSAVVRGSRATYRVHLNSGSIHVEPGGYLCVVPASFGRTGHRRLFLPFADEDDLTGVVLSKVLLLAEDDRITDPSILDQLDRLAPR
ncbi:uncharacterized protein DUF4132 [Micromonospora pisi]|uniref:Uncharacterized protein DUF4132 n=1 Tax=Micromonospora pisi TaxID=589240 RepID=A0A495JAX7_9ACTN|nr:DUF4132 domain-containing protein [Micromonospora pisi]RKR86166.1 uncharacterized protein DUF4132 [Micromonospora pisi]